MGRISKKNKQKIKRYFTPLTCALALVFLIIGFIGGYVYKQITKPHEEINEIKLLGNEIVDVTIGTIYKEDGYTFIIDGINYNDSVKVDDSSVNYDVLGTYSISYVLELGNESITLNRVINVIGGGQNE